MGKRLGQHFLKDKKILSAIAHEAFSLSAHPYIVEVGPGHGELTNELLAQGASHIVAVERDVSLAERLARSLAPQSSARLEIIKGDVREVLPKLPAIPCVIVGNIPYYLTGFLFRLLGDLVARRAFPIQRAVFLVQKEVAERAIADAPHMNLLAATLRGWTRPHIVFAVARHKFFPPPKVDSALLVLEIEHEATGEALSHYFETAKKLFRQPRKTLVNNLRESLSIPRDEAEQIVSLLGLAESARSALLTQGHIKTISKMMYN